MQFIYRSLILILCGVVLVGCKTNEEFFGTGPITLSPLAKAGFERYKKAGMNAGYFAVSSDSGNTSYGYSYCSAGQCSGNSLMVAIHSCENRSRGLDCKIYAEGPTVVWKTDKPAVASLGHIRDNDLCRMAVQNKTFKWDANVSNYVSEAKTRGITLEKCIALSGYKK